MDARPNIYGLIASDPSGYLQRDIGPKSDSPNIFLLIYNNNNPNTNNIILKCKV